MKTTETKANSKNDRQDASEQKKERNVKNPPKELHGGYTTIQMGHRIQEKEGIAKYVANSIIEDGMSIFLDAGSTVYQVGFELFKRKSQSGLTIMTNNMLVFRAFTDRDGDMYDRGNVLALTGGVYNKNHEALFGETAVQALKFYNPVVVIIGTSGFMAKEQHLDQSNQGAFHHDLVSEIVTKKAIAAKSTWHRVIVCDYSKIGVQDTSCFVTLEELTENTDHCTIVTSIVPNDLPPNEKKRYEDRFNETYSALQKLSGCNVEMVRVDYDGKPVLQCND